MEDESTSIAACTVVKTEFQHIPGSDAHLPNLHWTSTTVKTSSSDLPSTETGVHEHRTTSTVVETEFQHISGTETHLCNLHMSENDFI